MSENYSLKELNEWADKVIDCISKWADEMNKVFNGTPTSIKIEKLDFTEHDKVFEDKIADLEKRIRELIKEKDEYKRKCNAFGFENQELKQIAKGYEDKIAELENIINHKLGGWDKHGITYQKIMDMKAENDLLKQRIVESESKETIDLPFDPLECANYLINATYERETNGIERTFHNLPDKVNSDRYTVDDLEQIAEHLLVYCKHNKESEV